MVGIAWSLVAVTVGAIFAFAVTVSTPGISLPALGTVLMVVGMIGFATFLYLDWQRRQAYAPRNEPRYDDGQRGGRTYDQTTGYDRDRY